MKKEDAEYILACVDNEGLDYCFMQYSDFKKIKDKKFHELRKAYVDAADKLTKFVDDLRDEVE